MTEPYDIKDAFAAIEDELIDSMMRNMKRHHIEEVDEKKLWTMWQAEQLKALGKYRVSNSKKFGRRFSDINTKIGAVIREANKKGYMEQETDILKAIKEGFKGTKEVSDTIQAEFFKLNERKLEALIKATTDDMQKAEAAILRRADDQYRRVIFNAQVYANTGAGTYEKAVDMATKDMLSAGLQCVQYANGAMHSLSDYADMAIKTASKRAYLQGEGTKRQEWGISTVIINKRGNPCPKCLPFCGKVLIDDVWSGGKKTDGRYPLMSTAIAAGLYHPRCKDSHTTYFPGISGADDKWTKKELETVERAAQKETKQQYAKRQSDKYERLKKYSLDTENQKKYAAKAREWKTIESTYKNEKVTYNPENEYSVKIPGYSKRVTEGLTNAAADVAKKGTADGYEHMHLIDLASGEDAFYETNKEAGSVGHDFWKVIKKNPDRKYAFVHNHNIVSSLSESDLITAATTDSIPVMVAVQNDGVIYYAKKIKDVPDDFWPDEYFEKDLQQLQEDIRNGIITPAERAAKREEIIVRRMLEEFFDGMVVIDGKKE